VLECCRVLGLEVDDSEVPMALLDHAAEIFLTNSVQEVLPLERIGNRGLRGTTVANAILGAYRTRVQVERDRRDTH